MKEETELIKQKLKDLARRCYQKNTYMFSDFLTLNQQAVFHSLKKEISYVDFSLWGGVPGCERQMVRFGSLEQLGFLEDFPISCITVKPLQRKFSGDLTHRDFLGALMNLGIDRCVIGDIILREGVGYMICQDKIADYIADSLDRVRHTSVTCSVEKEMPSQAEPQLKEEILVVSAPRCDSIVAKAYQMSRNQSLLLFQSRKIFVNGQQYENNSGMLNVNDVVSVRGHGKFVYSGILQETKKGRFRVKIEKYV